jgi:cell division protease FtsH
MYYLPNHDPVHKVTIVPRGMAGGYTMPLPDEERQLFTKAKFKDMLVALLGGRVAEEIRFVDITTGASNDLERVTGMTRSMVTQWGMSEKLGPIRYGDREELVFLGREISERRNYSDKVAQEIDEEVRKFVDEAHRRCHQLLSTYWHKVDLIAAKLLEVETLDAQQFDALMRGEDPFRPTDSQSERRLPAPSPRSDEPSQSGDKRSDRGVDLGGTVPAPA